jgi:hypothetical protein
VDAWQLNVRRSSSATVQILLLLSDLYTHDSGRCKYTHKSDGTENTRATKTKKTSTKNKRNETKRNFNNVIEQKTLQANILPQD